MGRASRYPRIGTKKQRGIGGDEDKAMDANCPICLGIGWVCENHPDRAWDDELGCTCGAGEPCRCNAVGEPGVDEPDISQVIEDGEKTRH
jgi:hypothetical protein